MITRRENIFRVLRHERPEWIPVTGHADPYNQPSQEGMDPRLRALLKKVEWGDESTLNFSRYLNLDIADFVTPPVKITRRRVVLEEKTEGTDTIRTWHTPLGDLREVNRLAREDGTSYLAEHMLKEPEDIARLAAVFEDEVYETDPVLADQLVKRRQAIGGDGIVMISLPGTPLGMLYRRFSGVETLAYLWADAPRELQHLFAVMERSYLQQYRLAIASAGDAFVGMDDTSSNCISPAMFEACNLDLTNQRADLCHAAGKFYFHHSCGLIHDLLALYRQTRMDAVHAYTVPPVGDVTIAQGRPLLGDRITMFAGLGLLGESAWEPDALRAQIRRMCEEAAPGDHFMLCLAAYPNRTMAQTKFVADCCREYGLVKS